MKDINRTTGESLNGNSLNIREEIEKYLFYWKWFFLSCFVSVSLTFLYLRYASPQYKATGTIMIKDNQKSGISDELKAVADLGIVGTASSNNTDNEVEIIKSRKIIGNVVDTLELNVSYYIEGRVIRRELYNNAPIKMKFLQTKPKVFLRDTIISISILNNKTYELKNALNNKVNQYEFGEKVNDQKLGVFSVDLLKLDSNILSDVFIKIKDRDNTIDGYRNAVNVTPIGKNSSVLTLSIESNVLAKAEDFLDELVKGSTTFPRDLLIF
mgnify:CR=1 FL=1